MRRIAPLLVATVVMLVPAAAVANTITVHNTHDHGAGSLRKAIANANPGDTVKVPAGHYAVTSDELLVDTKLRIAGAGARKTVLDANTMNRVFEIDAAPGKVTISGLTVREGDAADDDGGGILANSDVVLARVALLKNHVDNQGFNSGGGVYGQTGAIVTVRQSLFAANVAYNGGAYDGAGGSEIHATDSTFANNRAGNPDFNGDGGFSNTAAVLTDSTVFGNSCFNGFGCVGGVAGGQTTLKGSIVAGNVAYEDNGFPAGSAGNPGVKDNCGDVAVTSLGHNLEGGSDCSLSGPGDLSGKNPRLGKLANNGGPTNTLAIRRASPAFNAGAHDCTSRDQRRVKRPQGPRCDIGAFELELP